MSESLMYEAVGAADNMAYSQAANHAHCSFGASQQPELAAFIDKFLPGQSGDANVEKLTVPPMWTTGWIGRHRLCLGLQAMVCRQSVALCLLVPVRRVLPVARVQARVLRLRLLLPYRLACRLLNTVSVMGTDGLDLRCACRATRARRRVNTTPIVCSEAPSGDSALLREPFERDRRLQAGHKPSVGKVKYELFRL